MPLNNPTCVADVHNDYMIICHVVHYVRERRVMLLGQSPFFSDKEGGQSNVFILS